MKTRKSKRLLAAFLAAIMVLTTLSVLPFSSYAAEHSPQDLKNLIDQVESRLEGETGTVYTNVSNTYEAWYSEEGAAMAEKFGVTAVPCVIFLNADGKEVKRLTGLRDYKTYEDALISLGWIE